MMRGVKFSSFKIGTVEAVEQRYYLVIPAA
jgi:hypothetical protein